MRQRSQVLGSVKVVVLACTLGFVPIAPGQALSHGTHSTMILASANPITSLADVPKPSPQSKPSASDPSTNLVVSGVILDSAGATVAGATVMLHAKDGGEQRSVTTGPSGEFRFGALKPGDYQIKVQRDDFQTWEKSLKIGNRRPPPLQVTLQLAEVTQRVIVAASNDQISAEAGENLDAITLNQQSLDSLPILGNDIVRTVTNLMAPGDLGSTGPTLIVDGVPVSNLGIPAAAIKEVKVNQDPYSAQFASPGRERIQVTTKTGSAEFHGSLEVKFRDYHLDARNAFATQRPPTRHLYLSGALSGPLGRGKKTTFTLSGERDADDLQAVVYAVTPAGIVSENVATPYRDTYLSAAVTHELNDNNTLSFRYSYYGSSFDGAKVGGLTLPEAAANTAERDHYLSLTDQALITPNLVNELSARFGTTDNQTTSALSGQPSVVVLGAFTGGGAQETKLDTSFFLHLTDVVSWSHGNHLLQAGVDVPAFNFWHLNDRVNFGGTFQFSSLQDYEQGIPFSFVQQQGDSHLLFWQKELGVFIQDRVRLRPNLSVSLGLRYDWQNYISNFKNFAPRFSFAYAPGRSGKTVIRGGAGIFYQTTGSTPIADMLRFNGQTMQEFVLSNPGYPNPYGLGGTAQALPSSIVRLAPNLRLPYVVQYSLGVERQITHSTTLTATYTGTQGFHQFLSRDINAPLPPNYVQRPDPSIATLRQIESSGRMESNALKVGLRANWGRLFEGATQYTFSHAYDNTGGIAWFPANQYDLSGEWGRASFDVRHSFSLYGTFNVGTLFKIGTDFSVRSGRPYTETTGTDVYGTTFSNARPPGVARNTLEGPGYVSLDMRVARDFLLRVPRPRTKESSEGLKLTLALDAFNVLNNVNRGQPIGDLTSPFFGQSVSADPARRLQISVGLHF